MINYSSTGFSFILKNRLYFSPDTWQGRGVTHTGSLLDLWGVLLHPSWAQFGLRSGMRSSLSGLGCCLASRNKSYTSCSGSQEAKGLVIN